MRTAGTAGRAAGRAVTGARHSAGGAAPSAASPPARFPEPTTADSVSPLHRPPRRHRHSRRHHRCRRHCCRCRHRCRRRRRRSQYRHRRQLPAVKPSAWQKDLPRASQRRACIGRPRRRLGPDALTRGRRGGAAAAHCGSVTSAAERTCRGCRLPAGHGRAGGAAAREDRRRGQRRRRRRRRWWRRRRRAGGVGRAGRSGGGSAAGGGGASATAHTPRRLCRRARGHAARRARCDGRRSPRSVALLRPTWHR